jgi:hypothetical protein
MSELENDSQEHVRHQGPSLTLEVLRKWQKALLQVRPLVSLWLDSKTYVRFSNIRYVLYGSS